MTPRLIHRIRVYPTPEQLQSLLSWRPRLATLQLCSDILYTAVLDGWLPELLHDPSALLSTAQAWGTRFTDPNRCMVSHTTLRVPNIYTQQAFKASLTEVQRLLAQTDADPLPMPVGTAQGLRRVWYDSACGTGVKVAGDFPQAKPAGRIGDFYFGMVRPGTQALHLGLHVPGQSGVFTWELAAELFALPAAIQDVLHRGGARLSEVVIQCTSTGTWAWLMLLGQGLPAAPPLPDKVTLGLDPNVRNLFVGWDGTEVPHLTCIPKASDGSLARRQEAFARGADQIETLTGELLRYATVGIEGTGRTAYMGRMEADLQRSFLTVVLDRVASTALAHGHRRLLQTAAPYTSRTCPRPGCGRKLASTSAPILTCPACELRLQRDELAARNHYHQAFSRPETLRPWWADLPLEFRHQLHLIR